MWGRRVLSDNKDFVFTMKVMQSMFSKESELLTVLLSKEIQSLLRLEFGRTIPTTKPSPK